MAKDDWRLRISLGEADRRGLLDRLGVFESDADELAHELKDRRLAVTEDGDTVFVYAGSAHEAERAKTAIQAELTKLQVQPDALVTEHWLADEERWDDDAPGPTTDEEILAEGYAPWEVRVQAADHHAARELADRLEAEGYGIVRRWHYVIAGCASQEQAEELAKRLHGEVEPGGELVWEATPRNPFALFGGLADS